MTKNRVPSAMMVEIAAAKLTRPRLAPWSIGAARQIVSRGFKRTLQKAYSGAGEDQKAQLASELNDLLSYVREMTG